jgi:hypothetical protein
MADYATLIRPTCYVLPDLVSPPRRFVRGDWDASARCFSVDGSLSVVHDFYNVRSFRLSKRGSKAGLLRSEVDKWTTQFPTTKIADQTKLLIYYVESEPEVSWVSNPKGDILFLLVMSAFMSTFAVWSFLVKYG